MTLLPALAFGLALGVRHATDADHVAAISTIVAEDRSISRAARVGVTWGVGHSLSVLLVGGALSLLRLPMPPRVALALEFLAALMLIALGIRSLVSRGRARPLVAGAPPLAIGVMHGLAGSAVLALLVLGATTGLLDGTLYLLCFCLGTIIGMAAVTALIATPATMLPPHVGIGRALHVAAGVASLTVGLAMAHRIGVQDGLFAATLGAPE